MTRDESEHGRVGIAVYCAVCYRRKQPHGRSAPVALAGSLCDLACSGYDAEPRVGDLWPDERCEDFGHAHGHEATGVHVKDLQLASKENLVAESTGNSL